MIDESQRVTGDALKWLLEMEAVHDPNVINALVLNVYRMSKYIKDVQFVFDMPRKKSLVYIQLSWWGGLFHRQKIMDLVENMLSEALPSFEKRIIDKREILEKALDLIEKSNISKKRVQQLLEIEDAKKDNIRNA